MEEIIMLGNGKMVESMVKELSPGQMETNTKGNGNMEDKTVKELSLLLIGKNMLGKGKMGENTVKEQTFSLMGVKELESSEKVVLGTLLTGIKTETS